MPRKQGSSVGLQGSRFSEGGAAVAAANNRKIIAENFKRTLVRQGRVAARLAVEARV